MIDYEIVLRENTVIDQFKTVVFPVSKGIHSFKFSYGVFFPSNSNKFANYAKIQIKDLVIYGVLDDLVLKCKECTKGFSNGTHCISCYENHYYDEEQKKCYKCPSNTFSYACSIGKDSCFSSNCGNYSYIARESECISYEKKVLFDYNYPLLCNKSNLTLPKNYTKNCFIEGYHFISNWYLEPTVYMAKCPIGGFTNQDTLRHNRFYCQSCPQGHCTPLIAEYNYFLFNLKDFSNECGSFNFNECDYIKGWKFLEDRIITGENLPKNLNLSLSLNTTILEKTGIIRFEIILDMSENESFDFLINNNTIKDFNKSSTIEIQLTKKFYNFTWLYKRRNCNKKQNSIEIKNIYIENSDKGISKGCRKCDNEDSERKVCPIFTSSYKNGKCVLNDIIESKIYHKKFNLKMLKSIWVTKEGYRLKFISLPSVIPEKNEFFLMSPFNPHPIDGNIGYIFKQSYNSIINIGKTLDYVKIYSDISGKNLIKKRGILLKYNNGEECKFDNQKSYQSYLFITCNKKSSKNFPTLFKVEDCTYIFEWMSTAGCPFCLKSEVILKKEACNNGKSEEYYEEINDCIISNEVESTREGIDNPYNDYILSDEDLFNDNYINYYFKMSNLSFSSKKIYNLINDSYVDFYYKEELCGKAYLFLNYLGIIFTMLLIILFLFIFLIYIRKNKKSNYYQLKSKTINNNENNEDIIELI